MHTHRNKAMLILLACLISSPVLAHADDYWRGWCRGQVQAANTLHEERNAWLGRGGDALPDDLQGVVGFRLLGIVVDVVDAMLKQLPLYLAPALVKPGQSVNVTVYPEGHVIQCPEGTMVKPGPEK
jgi:hypothetical protein